MSADLVASVTARRQQLGISQSEIARQMKERGHDWHQVTVARTEHRTRPLRFDEALDYAAILGIPLTPLVDESLVAELDAARKRIAFLQEQVRELTEVADRAADAEALISKMRALLDEASDRSWGVASDASPTPSPASTCHSAVGEGLDAAGPVSRIREEVIGPAAPGEGT